MRHLLPVTQDYFPGFSQWPKLCLNYSFAQKASVAFVLNRKVCWGSGWLMGEYALPYTWLMWCDVDGNIILFSGYPESSSYAVLSLFLGNPIVHRTHANIITIQFRGLCWLLQIYFGTRVIFFAVLFCVLFSLTFCSVLFCVICANAAGFSITLSCECAYVIRSPPTQKSVPLSQRAGWEPEHDALHCFCLSSMCYFLLLLLLLSLSLISCISLYANQWQVGSSTATLPLAREANRPLNQSRETIVQTKQTAILGNWQQSWGGSLLWSRCSFVCWI